MKEGTDGMGPIRETTTTMQVLFRRDILSAMRHGAMQTDGRGQNARNMRGRC